MGEEAVTLAAAERVAENRKGIGRESEAAAQSESREEEEIGSVGGLGLRWLVGWIRFICLRERARHPNYSRKTGK